MDRFVAISLVGLINVALNLSSLHAQTEISFNRDVRPILAKHCWACHGPDADSRQADLRLDSFEAATQSVIRPGDAAHSELLHRVLSKDAEEVMPPPEAGSPLTPTQVETLRKWIESGARYESHWAFVPPTRPALPNVQHTQWPSAPTDYFILEKIEAAKLAPPQPADRSTLLRRVYLDLIGLPPTSEQINAFVQSQDPSAYENVVNDLLASPAFGEKWGRAWLDLARYSDTNGYEKDRTRSIWPFRDWVINAINADMPFDQFTVHQIAGDMLAPDDLNARIATGFHRNTMLNEEGGIDPLEFRFYAMNDRVATTGLVWMGLTTGCAQCHTHKFDPISHTEYYAFMALLNNADEPDQEIVTNAILEERSRIQKQIESKASALAEQFPLDAETSKDLSSQERAAQSRKLFDTKFSAWIDQLTTQAVEWQVMQPAELKSNLPRLEVLDDGSIFSTGDITKRDVYELKIKKESLDDKPLTALRLEVLPDPRLPAGGPGRCYYEGRRGDFFLSEVTIRDGERNIKLREGSHSYGKNGLGSGSADAKNVFDGDGSTGWSTAQREGQAHELVLILDEPLQAQGELTIEMLFERHYAASLGRFRWSFSSSDRKPVALDLPAELSKLVLRDRSTWSDTERQSLERHFALTCAELTAARKEIEQLRQSMPTAPSTLVMQERPADNPRATHRHHRGEYLSPRETVVAGLPQVFRDLTAKPPTNRLELARWLASRENPLVARVMVNRVWQSLFGDGLVRSQGDFGMQCTPPTHPQLLDWLAVEWMESGWSMKQLLRSIVLSSTYQQSSAVTPDLQQRDPENLLFARFARQRVDAEVLRDCMLHSSQLISRQVGGPSVRPPQPASVTALAYGGEAWPESKGADRYRRSIYTFSKRTAPFAAYQAFDAPSGETCAVRRDRSNTPLQALTLMNDAMFLEFAEAIGCDIAMANEDNQARATRLAQIIWSRQPTPDEVDAIAHFVAGEQKRILGGESSPEIVSTDNVRLTQALRDAPPQRRAELMAWILAARAVMNTDEAVVKP